MKKNLASVLLFVCFFSPSTQATDPPNSQQRAILAEAVPVEGGPAALTALDGAWADATASGAAGSANAEKTLANGLVLAGPWAAVWDGSVVGLSVNRIENNSTTRTSGTLRLELWATSTPPARGASFTGYRLSVFSTFEPLAPRMAYFNITRAGQFLRPPDGTYWMVLVLSEFSASCPTADSYCGTDSINSDTTATFGTTLPALTPQTGTWWNPAESGTGYALDIQHGVLTMLVFSYQSTGSPEWYYVSGPLTGNGRNFTATLDKYRGGQCISCFYNGRPSQPGNDGSVSITFFSATAGVMSLPGGRVTFIQRMTF
jgi:hypothetical protein